MYGGFPITTSAGLSSIPESMSASRKSACRTQRSASADAVERGLARCDQLVTAQRAADLYVLRLQVVGPDGITKRCQVPSVSLRASDKTLKNGAKERPGTTGWFEQAHLAQVAVGGVPREIEQNLDHPSAGEHLAGVLHG